MGYVTSTNCEATHLKFNSAIALTLGEVLGRSLKCLL